MRNFGKKLPLLLLTPLLLFVGCNNQPTKNIGITGAFALYPLAVKWSENYKQSHPNDRFDISAGGAGKGLTDVLAGAADLGMFSRQLSDAELQKGIWYVIVAKDAVLPTVSAQNPLIHRIHEKGLTQEQFKNIFVSGTPVTWGSVLDTAVDTKINVYTRSDAAGAADTWAAFFKAKQENIKGVGIFGDPGLADAVAKDPKGIGFNNTAYVYDIKTGEKNPKVDVVPIDLNGDRKIDSSENFYSNSASILQAIALGKYPSPPARPLYFISKGKPTDKRIIDFLNWILTEGQSLVKEQGYVPLDAATIQQQIDKLK